MGGGMGGGMGGSPGPYPQQPAVPERLPRPQAAPLDFGSAFEHPVGRRRPKKIIEADWLDKIVLDKQQQQQQGAAPPQQQQQQEHSAGMGAGGPSPHGAASAAVAAGGPPLKAEISALLQELKSEQVGSLPQEEGPLLCRAWSKARGSQQRLPLRLALASANSERLCTRCESYPHLNVGSMLCTQVRMREDFARQADAMHSLLANGGNKDNQAYQVGAAGRRFSNSALESPFKAVQQLFHMPLSLAPAVPHASGPS